MVNSKFTVLLVAIMTLSGFVVAGAWTDAPANPPANNVAAPLNVGTDNQTKLGSLILNADTVSPDVFGLDVFGDSRIFGRLTSDTDVCIENDLQTICLSDLASSNNSYTLSTSESCDLVYDSMTWQGENIGVAGRTGYVSVELPDNCITDGTSGCAIKQEVYKKKTSKDPTPVIHKVLVNDFWQSATPSNDGTGASVWSSTYNRKGTRQNGNTTSTNIVPPIGGEDVGYILIRDDRATMNNTGVQKGSKYNEVDPKWVSMYDSMSGYAQKVYFCNSDTILTPDQEAEEIVDGGGE